MKQLRFGLIGYKFMGKAHSKAYTEVPMYMDPPEGIVKAVLCGREEEWVKKVALQLGWQDTETDWRRLVALTDMFVLTHPHGDHYCREGLEAYRAAGKPVVLPCAPARLGLSAARPSG